MGLPVSFSANAADEEGRQPFNACGVHGSLRLRRTNPDAFRFVPARLEGHVDACGFELGCVFSPGSSPAALTSIVSGRAKRT
jgi:hypothetical protein